MNTESHKELSEVPVISETVGEGPEAEQSGSCGEGLSGTLAAAHSLAPRTLQCERQDSASGAGGLRPVPATAGPQASVRPGVWDPHTLVCDGVLTHFLSVSQAPGMSPGELVFLFISMSPCPAPVPQGLAGGSCSIFDLLSE